MDIQIENLTGKMYSISILKVTVNQGIKAIIKGSYNDENIEKGIRKAKR